MAETIPTLEAARQFFGIGRLENAAKICHAILARDAQNAGAHDLAGLIALAQQQFLQALGRFDRAAALAPRLAEVHLHRGMALRGLGRTDEAIVALQQAVTLAPAAAAAHLELGNALKKAGRLAEAVVSLRAASRLAPNNAATWLNLGAAWLESGKPAEAIPCLRRGVELEPERLEAHNILGAALADQGALAEAEATFRAVLRERPDYAGARNNLARVLKGQGKLSEAVEHYRAALRLRPDPATHSNLLYALNFISGISPEAIWAEHQQWGKTYASSLYPTGISGDANRDERARLRVGFVSPDFVNHAISYFFEPLLAHRNRSEWEVFCYSDALVPDRVTERLRGLSDHWRNTGALNDGQLDSMIRQDRLDLLVDLTGHTARNRLLVFARKPAPFQATWLGYPNTTGVAAIDYRVTDNHADPEGATDCWHAEKLLRLPGCFLCYQPPTPSPEVNPSPLRTVGHVTFGSFSNFTKISDPCVETWAAILASVPDSTLVLKSRGLDDPATATAAKERFARHGICPERIVLDGKLVGTKDHLALYHAVDIALDPFPYNGTTTTCEALWMGVPVISLVGSTHVSRVGVSLLHAIGRPEWLANSREDYVERAVALATDTAALGEIRSGLRDTVVRSRLCNAASFAREMEIAIRAIVVRG